MKPAIPTEYRLHDPDHLGPCEEEALRHLAWFDHDEPFCLGGFTVFSMAVQLGFRRLTYESQRLDSNHYFWITDEHARMIGRALAPSLRYWGLVLTTFAGRGFDLICNNTADEVQIAEVLIKHTSGDEVTVTEARGLARLVTKLGSRTVHLWAVEYDPGAVDALCQTLLELDNKTIVELDVCDTSRPEPEDQIALPAIDDLLARNAAATGIPTR